MVLFLFVGEVPLSVSCAEHTGSIAERSVSSSLVSRERRHLHFDENPADIEHLCGALFLPENICKAYFWKNASKLNLFLKVKCFSKNADILPIKNPLIIAHITVPIPTPLKTPNPKKTNERIIPITVLIKS